MYGGWVWCRENPITVGTKAGQWWWWKFQHNKSWKVHNDTIYIVWVWSPHPTLASSTGGTTSKIHIMSLGGWGWSSLDSRQEALLRPNYPATPLYWMQWLWGCALAMDQAQPGPTTEGIVLLCQVQALTSLHPILGTRISMDLNLNFFCHFVRFTEACSLTSSWYNNTSHLMRFEFWMPTQFQNHWA